MISSNNLLKSAIRSAEEHHHLNNNFNKIKTENFSIKEESEREIVIINPTLDDGQGDFELARKLEKLITVKGLRVAVISLIKKCNDEGFLSTYSYENIPGEPKNLKNKLVVIAPFSFCKPEVLIQVFKNNVIITENTKIVMIDEIEANAQCSFHNYKEEFRKIGIKHVYEEKLGSPKQVVII